MARRPVLALLALPLVLALAACDPGSPVPADDPVVDPPVTEEEPPAAEPLDLPDDALVAVSATIEASNGATMRVLSVVRRSLAWGDPAGADRAARMTEECAGYLDDAVYASALWSFTVVDVTATLIDGAWPSGEGVVVFPDPAFTAVAESGVLGEADVDDGATPHCFRPKTLTQPGAGAIVVGLHGDTDAVGAAGGFTRWANHTYGYAALDPGLGMTDCELTVTPLGEESGWSDAAGAVTEDGLCRFGIFTEDVDR